MGWNELVSAAENNPEMKALLKRMAGGLEETAPSIERDVTPKGIIPYEAPPIDTKGEIPSEPTPQERASPNFELQPEHGASLDYNTELPVEKTGGLSASDKAALGMGALGAAGAGYLASQDGGGSTPPSTNSNEADDHVARMPASNEDANKEAAIEKIAAKEKNKKSEPVEETTAPSKDRTVDEIGEEEKANYPERGVDLNFGSVEQNKNGLDEALKQKEHSLDRAMLQRGLERLTGGVAKIAPNYDFSNETEKRANAPIEEYQMRQQAQESDPNSGISMGMRDYIKRMGINVSDGATASQLKQVLPMVFKDVEAKQAQQAKTQDLALKQQELGIKRDELKQRANETRTDKLDKQDLAEGKDIFNQMNALKASSKSALGQAITSKIKAKRLIDLVSDPSATPQDMTSAAADLNSIVSQTTTMSGTQHQEYNNLQSEFTKYANYLKSGADPVSVPQVRQHLAHIANRMMDISDQFLSANTAAVKQFHGDYEKRHPGQIDATAALVSGINQPADAKINITPEMANGAKAELEKRMKAKGQQ